MPQVVQVCGTVIIDVLAFLFLLLGMLIASAWLFQNLTPGIVNVPGGMPTVAVQRRNHVSLEGLLLWPDTVRLLWALGGPTVL